MKSLQLQQLSRGDSFKTFGDTFVKLDNVDGCILVIRKKIWELAAFDTRECNNLRNATIFARLTDYHLNLRKEIEHYEEIGPMMIDLKSTTGYREYGFYNFIYVGLLTLEQYGQYQEYIPVVDEPYWLATPFMTPKEMKDKFDPKSWVVTPDGRIADRDVATPYGIRPILLFPTTLFVDIDEEEDIKTANHHASYESYLQYLKNWIEVPEEGQSPLSFEIWIRRNQDERRDN